MVTNWQDLIDLLAAVQTAQYRSNPERDEARLEQLEFVVSRMLEMLRDQDEAALALQDK